MKKKHVYIDIQKGQALITLIFFAVIGITITSAAIIMMYVNSLSGLELKQGITASQIAESGAENAILRMLRNPSYTGETLPIGEGTAIITVSGTGPYTIISEGRVGNFIKKIQINATYTNNLFVVTSRREVF